MLQRTEARKKKLVAGCTEVVVRCLTGDAIRRRISLNVGGAPFLDEEETIPDRSESTERRPHAARKGVGAATTPEIAKALLTPITRCPWRARGVRFVSQWSATVVGFRSLGLRPFTAAHLILPVARVIPPHFPLSGSSARAIRAVKPLAHLCARCRGDARAHATATRRDAK